VLGRKRLRQKRKSLGLLITVVLAVFFPSGGSSGFDFDIKPKLSGSWMAETNYYREEFEEKGVYTYLLQPGIDLAFKTAKSLVELDYTLDAYYHDDQDPNVGGRSPDDYLGHTFTFKSRTKPTSRITLGLDDSFYLTRDPYQSDILSNRRTREEYWINRLTPRAVYRLGRRLSAGARYRWTEQQYDRQVFEDSTEHRGIFDLIYSFNPRAHLDLQYQHWQMTYDRDTSDYTSDQIELLFKKQFHYLALVVGGGYQDRRFDDPDQKDIDTPTWKIGFDAQNPPSGGRLKTYGSLYFIQDLPIWHDQQDYYVARRVAAEAGHVIKGRIPVRIAAQYQNSEYDAFTGLTSDGTMEKRDDDGYGIQGSLGYLFTDRVLLSATAGYEKRDSNIVGLSYENQYVMVELSFAYEIGHRPALHFPW
jgi:hypothetical protein